MEDKNDIVILHKMDESQGNEDIIVTWRHLADGTYAQVVSASIEDESYLGEETLTATGSAQPATLPDGTKAIWIFPEGGLARATVNGTATVNSGVYAPDGNARYSGRFDNIESFSVLADADVKIHLVFVG